jgi:hypothetical protein
MRLSSTAALVSSHSLAAFSCQRACENHSAPEPLPRQIPIDGQAFTAFARVRPSEAFGRRALIPRLSLTPGRHPKPFPITAAEILNDRVVPFYDEHGIRLSRMLTDRGTEFCGSQSHEYEFYHAVEDVDHRRTKTKSPQTNGICERFHRTVLDEFYRVAFRRKMDSAIDELQADLDVWLVEYNEQRSHRGRWCFGKTPMQTFLDRCQWRRRNSWLLDNGQQPYGLKQPTSPVRSSLNNTNQEMWLAQTALTRSSRTARQASLVSHPVFLTANSTF